MKLISLDLAGLFTKGTGLSLNEFDEAGPRMRDLQREVTEVDERIYASGEIPPEKQPLDHGFYRLPERILEDYRRHRDNSELGRVLRVAHRLHESVDRVVVLGIGGSYMGARALMEACCQPYYNELSRADRGGKPRLYFEGNNVDNDAARGLLHMLNVGRKPQSIDDRWGLIVISKSGGTLETAVALRIFLKAFEQTMGAEAIPQFVIPVTGSTGKLANLSEALGCETRLSVPDGVGGRFSVFSSVGLLPAAVLGLNVISLLEGAIAMNDHFRQQPPGANLVLDYVNACQLAERHGYHIRVLSVWAKALESVGLWYDQLLAESLGKQELGATPLTTVNTRDLHSRQQQHQEGRRDKLFTNLIVDSWRTDPLHVGSSPNNQDALNDLADKTLADIMNAAIRGTNEALQSAGRPTMDLHLPAVDEATLGQLLQMFMLATVVEGRMLGINPYGQPGVEGYKQNMNRLLGRTGG